jgi:hypothetical protein
MVGDALSRLEYDPMQNLTDEYTHATVRVPTGEPIANKCNASLNTSDIKMNAGFANCSEDDEINPLPTHEIAEAQQADAT